MGGRSGGRGRGCRASAIAGETPGKTGRRGWRGRRRQERAATAKRTALTVVATGERRRDRPLRGRNAPVVWIPIIKTRGWVGIRVVTKAPLIHIALIVGAGWWRWKRRGWKSATRWIVITGRRAWGEKVRMVVWVRWIVMRRRRKIVLLSAVSGWVIA